MTSGLLDAEEEEDKGVYNEEIIAQCAQPMPNPYFVSDDFLDAFENQCNQVSRDWSAWFTLEYIFASEPRLLKLKSPVYVFGDFHGNIADLIAFSKILWPLGMHLTPGSFLFLGDYVDRGQYSIEVLSYLFAQKIMLPDKVFVLRQPLLPGPIEGSLRRERGQKRVVDGQRGVRLPPLRRLHRRRDLLRARRHSAAALGDGERAGEHQQDPLPHGGARGDDGRAVQADQAAVERPAVVGPRAARAGEAAGPHGVRRGRARPRSDLLRRPGDS